MMFNRKVTKDLKYQCDVCGKEDGYFEDIRPEYQTKHTKKCCGDCSYILNKKLSDIIKIKNDFGVKLMREFIEEQRLKKRYKK